MPTFLERMWIINFWICAVGLGVILVTALCGLFWEWIKHERKERNEEKKAKHVRWVEALNARLEAKEAEKGILHEPKPVIEFSPQRKFHI